MKKLRAFFFLSIIFALAAVTILLIQQPVQPPLSRSLSNLLQELGKPLKSADRAISCILPIDEIDEKMLGEEMKATLAQISIQDEATVQYLNSLMQSFREEIHSPFEYTVFLIENGPNACALPGGVICVTTGLMELLESEAELVAILGHEIGHIERGHLFDAARGEMLRRKIDAGSIASYASAVIHSMMHFAFSKSQEDEADEFGFRLLVKKQYDPFAMSAAFEKIANHQQFGQQPLGVIDDFFATHPHIALRMEKFSSRAELWKANYPNEKWYSGKKNFANRISRLEKDYSEEWNRHATFSK